MSYRVAPIFLIRLAGAPFEILEHFGTPETINTVRGLLLAQQEIGGETVPSLGIALQRELEASRKSLFDSACTILPRYLIFSLGEMRNRIASLSKGSRGIGSRNSRTRERERHVLLYLQRIAAKNDTFSEFGPSGWGTMAERFSGLRLAPESGIAEREAFLERWTAHAIAAAINADPENSNSRLIVPALEPHAVEILLKDVRDWPTSPARDKWLPILQGLIEIPSKFITAVKSETRQSISDETRTRLKSIGAQPKPTDRYLYAATNPICEECFRKCHFEINQGLIDEVAVQAEPWIDLWRDNYAFVASRVAAGLRGVIEKAGAKGGAIPLPAFLQACEAVKLPLTGPGLVALAVMAFQEVKAAFRERLQPHSDLNEYELTTEDCHIVRDNFEYPKFDEYTFPSADLQLAAASTAAVARGDYQWILAELHAPVAVTLIIACIGVVQTSLRLVAR